MSARKFEIDKTKKFGNVKIIVTDNGIICRLHQTNVAVYDKDRNTVTLTSGGWRTRTTLTAINTFLGKIGSSYKVYQRKGDWFIMFPENDDAEFFDNVTLSFDADAPNLPDWF